MRRDSPLVHAFAMAPVKDRNTAKMGNADKSLMLPQAYFYQERPGIVHAACGKGLVHATPHAPQRPDFYAEHHLYQNEHFYGLRTKHRRPPRAGAASVCVPKPLNP